MKLTAKEAAERLSVSYVIAAGLLSHLEEVGKAKVVEKKFHSSGKGKPTRIYEVDQHTVLDFGSDVVATKVADVVESTTQPEVLLPSLEELGVVVVEGGTEAAPVEKIETLDHVAAALKRLKEAQEAEAA
jgi:predicted ArsR family transcriptional regulator